MNKTLNLDVGRQTILSASIAFTHEHVADTGVAVKAINLPYGAIVQSGFVVVDTAFDNVTSAVLDVGDVLVANRYKNDVNLKVAGVTELVPTGYVSDGEAIYITPALVGAGTTGSARLVVNYTIEGRAGETQPN